MWLYGHWPYRLPAWRHKQIVEPTNLKSGFLKSLLIVSHSFIVAGISFNDFQLFCRVKLPTNSQIYLSKLPNSFCTSKNTLAFVTEAATFKRYRTTPLISQKFLLFGVNIFCNLSGYKIIISIAIIIALIKDCWPTNPCLSTF